MSVEGYVCRHTLLYWAILVGVEFVDETLKHKALGTRGATRASRDSCPTFYGVCPDASSDLVAAVSDAANS